MADNRLWHLYPHDAQNNPWGGYDKAYAAIVRAPTESEARLHASKHCGDEGEAAWLNLEHSACVELGADGPVGIIVQDFHSG